MASDQLMEIEQPQTKRKNASKGLERQQKRWGLIFLSPWIFGFTVFTAAPILISLYWTFTDYTLASGEPPTFVGLQNWIRLFTDPLALKALQVTATFALISVPIYLIVPLGMAALLNAEYLWGKRVWRTLFYLPYMVPAVSGIFIWQAFYNGQTGWLNRMLRMIGFENPPNWLQDERTILTAFLFMGFWGVGNAMLTMLASMQGVPNELYEAADVDGAGAWTKFTNITIPMISPVIFYNLVLIAIGMMQYFVVPYIITRGTGQPNNAAYFYNIHFYKTTFTFFDMGYGATQAWFIFLISLVLTVLLFTTSGRWVFYAGGD
ncbi:MAG: carbohydrate ABC transporter permease [Anaerolineae bacterium]